MIVDRQQLIFSYASTNIIQLCKLLHCNHTKSTIISYQQLHHNTIYSNSSKEYILLDTDIKKEKINAMIFISDDWKLLAINVPNND